GTRSRGHRGSTARVTGASPGIPRCLRIRRAGGPRRPRRLPPRRCRRDRQGDRRRGRQEGSIMDPVIRTERLTKGYGSHRGIIEVDLAIQAGGAFGFLGPKGAGKTTTIRPLLDHIRPTSGLAFIFDIETTVDPVAIHRRVGYLPGEFTLYDKLTGRQTIDYFANLRGGVDATYHKELMDRIQINTRTQRAR